MSFVKNSSLAPFNLRVLACLTFPIAPAGLGGFRPAAHGSLSQVSGAPFPTNMGHLPLATAKDTCGPSGGLMLTHTHMVVFFSLQAKNPLHSQRARIWAVIKAFWRAKTRQKNTSERLYKPPMNPYVVSSCLRASLRFPYATHVFPNGPAHTQNCQNCQNASEAGPKPA